MRLEDLIEALQAIEDEHNGGMYVEIRGDGLVNTVSLEEPGLSDGSAYVLIES